MKKYFKVLLVLLLLIASPAYASSNDLFKTGSNVTVNENGIADAVEKIYDAVVNEKTNEDISIYVCNSLDEVVNKAYEVAKEGATIEVPVVTDLEYNVEIPQSATSWISLAETKAVRQESINLVVSSNSNVQRSAEVNITDSVNGEVLATINIIQKSA